MLPQQQRRRFLWITVSVAVLIILSIIFGGFVFVRAQNKRGFKLVRITATNGFPHAEFQKELLRYRWLRVKSFGSNTRIHVLRHGTWAELSLSETQKLLVMENMITDGAVTNRTARIGYTITVKVPVCQTWKLETEIYETRRIGFANIRFDLKSTNRWQSEELPGWSEIRKDLNRSN